jgi:hypothetical protein
MITFLRTATRPPAALVLVALAALTILLGSASAGIPTLGFDELPTGTVVSNQYLASGVLFVASGPHGGVSQLPTVTAVPASQAESGTKVATAYACGHDFCQPYIIGKFANPRRYVNVYVGAATAGAPPNVDIVLTAYDASDTSLQSDEATVAAGSGYRTELSVGFLTQKIAYFEVRAKQSGVTIGIDDVSFDATGSTKPDFAILATSASTALALHAGGTTSATLSLTRFGGSTGDIRFSTSDLPKGVTPAFAPGVSATGDATVTMTLSAAADAPSTSSVPFTAVATPFVASAGTVPHSVAFGVSVDASFDSRVNGIEVQQGVQTAGLPARNPAKPNDPVPYTGVKLAAGRQTVVRVYANLKTAAPAGSVEGHVALYGTRSDGSKLLPSPLTADIETRGLVTGPALVMGTGERYAPKGAFSFTLPPSWTSGTVSLRAQLTAYATGFGSPDECKSCLDDNTFVLTDVVFDAVQPYSVDTISMSKRGSTGALIPMPDPEWVFRDVRRVLPFPQSQLQIGPYLGAIDISDIANDTTLGGDGGDGKNDAVLQRLKDWEKGDERSGNSTVGVNTATARGNSTHVVFCHSSLGLKYDCTGDIPVAVVEYKRPLGSVSHELMHGFYIPHAGPICGGSGEDWLPDQRGYVDGVGLDVTPGSGGGPGLHGIHVAGEPGQPAFMYDPMSYCNSDEASMWISPTNWNRLVMHGASPITASWSSSAAPAAPTLEVDAFSAPGGGVRISEVGPAPRIPTGFQPSTLRLVARSMSGRVLASGPMTASPMHSDPGQLGAYLQGWVPAARVASVEIVDGSKVVARRARSAHAPRVQLLAPRAGRLPGVGTVPLRWNATDADGGPLLASVDYSTDAGKTWRTVFVGPAFPNGVNLSSTYFPRSGNARLRLRVGDGFNETAVLSGQIVSPGRAPTVRILSPTANGQLPPSGALYLDGNAFSDAGTAVPGQSLRWFVNNVLVGTGNTVRTDPLAAGPLSIRLEARDALGRVGTATETLTLPPAEPHFLVLEAPEQVSASASQATLTIAATVPSKLTVGAQSYTVDRTARQIAVPLMPGSSVAELQLRLSAPGGTAAATLKVDRH